MNREFQPEENIIVTISCSYTNSEILIRILIFEKTLLLLKRNRKFHCLGLLHLQISIFYLCLSLNASIICKI